MGRDVGICIALCFVGTTVELTSSCSSGRLAGFGDGCGIPTTIIIYEATCVTHIYHVIVCMLSGELDNKSDRYL